MISLCPKAGNFRVPKHLNIMTYLKSISIGIYMYIKIDRGINSAEAVAQKLSNVRMYGICASVCDLNFDLFYFVSSLSSMNRCRK